MTSYMTSTSKSVRGLWGHANGLGLMIKESNAIYSKGHGIFILLKECLANLLPIQKFERYFDEMIEKSFPDQNCILNLAIQKWGKL